MVLGVMKPCWTHLITVVVALAFIPALAEANSGDFNGGVAIGSSYAGVDSAPTNGLIVQGNVGIGTISPAQTFEVNGTVQIDTGLIVPLIYPASDSTTAIQIDKANGSTNVLDVDTTNGRVGIGTTAPKAILDVRSTGDDEFFYRNSADIYAPILRFLKSRGTISSPAVVNNGDTTGVLTFEGYDGSTYQLAAAVEGLVDGTVASGSVPTDLVFLTGTTSDSTEHMRILSSGNVGIGNTSPSYLLHVGSSSASGIVMELQNSSGACTYNPGASSVTVSCSSDMRLKTDIRDSEDALAWVHDMRIRDFRVRATGERKTGVIAQEVMLKHPEMVRTSAEGTYLVDEPNPWTLVKAVQEQQDEIEELKRTIEQLKQRK